MKTFFSIQQHSNITHVPDEVRIICPGDLSLGEGGLQKREWKKEKKDYNSNRMSNNTANTRAQSINDLRKYDDFMLRSPSFCQFPDDEFEKKLNHVLLKEDHKI